MLAPVQILEITIRNSAKIAECCDKVSQRGTLARIGNTWGDYVLIAVIVIGALFALACVAGLLFLAYENRRMARLQAIIVPSPYYDASDTTIVDFASLNVQPSQPKTVKGKL
jgi:hypothetical protein